jgi:hypothetical protein
MRVIIRALLLVLLIALVDACNLSASLPTPVPTADLPRAEFRFPQNNSTVIDGTDLAIDIVARDDSAGIARIELLVDGTLINQAAPVESAVVPVFRVTMNWLAQGIGKHAVETIAYRLDGTRGDPATIVIEVLPRQ